MPHRASGPPFPGAPLVVVVMEDAVGNHLLRLVPHTGSELEELAF